MMRENDLEDRRVKKKHFSFSVFIPVFLVLCTLTTVQNKILGSYIDYSAIEFKYYIFMGVYWVFTSAVFTLFTRWEIKRAYDKPLQEFAKATRRVAEGDFSVYLKPVHTVDRADYLDVMMLDFNKMVGELGSIETLKTDFFSNVSHEIKTPIAIIQNYEELLQKPGLTEAERMEYTQAVRKTTRRLSDLITNILKLGKLEKQTIKPMAEEYDLCSQLCECALNFESLWEDKNIEFEAEIEDEAGIKADRDLMELVWNNLLSNAFKFTEPGGIVSLKQTSGNGEITVEVKDTGCGMSRETMEHIFDKFYQGDSSHATEGNGLGLALALRILELMGYTITVESQAGVGTTFTVRIPLSERNSYEIL